MSVQVSGNFLHRLAKARPARSLRRAGIGAVLWAGGHGNGGSESKTRPGTAKLRVTEIGEGAAPKDRGSGRGRARSGGSLPGVLRGDVPSGTSGGQPAVPGTDRVGEDAHCGSRGGDTVRGPAGGDQGGLRGVSALARDCQADWLAAWVSGGAGETA